MSPSSQVRDADKRAALEEVLGSTTFLRANQARKFLRYICEMELAGRGATLHEYLIGVEALGRPTAYSTEDDSSVRRRAYALRQKLDEVYAKELTSARLRIDVPKGSYMPRFIPMDEVGSRAHQTSPSSKPTWSPRNAGRRSGQSETSPMTLAAELG